MRILTEEEKIRLKAEVEREFPDDEMMQEIHYVRLLHQLQTEGMTVGERKAFYSANKDESSK